MTEWLAEFRIGGKEGFAMREVNRIGVIALLLLVVALPGVSKKRKDDPLATLNFVIVRDDGGKPIRNAAVVMHPVDEDGKQTAQGLELKTNPEGKASYEGVPYGKIRVQVLASGFQTYGDDYDIREPSRDITIKMKRPGRQYSIYEDHPEQKKEEPEKK